MISGMSRRFFPLPLLKFYSRHFFWCKALFLDKMTTWDLIRCLHFSIKGFWTQQLQCVSFFPTTTKQFSDTTWVSYNSTQFWHFPPEIASDSKGEGISPTRLPSPTPQLQMPVASRGYHLCFWPTSYGLEVPKTHSLGLSNLLEGSQNSEKHFTY